MEASEAAGGSAGEEESLSTTSTSPPFPPPSSTSPPEDSTVDNNNTKTNEEATLNNLSTLPSNDSHDPDEDGDEAQDDAASEGLGDSEEPELSRLIQDPPPGPPTPAHLQERPKSGPKTPHKSVRVRKESERVLSEAHVLNQVQKLCLLLDLEFAQLSYEKFCPAERAEAAKERVLDGLGFCLEIRPSQVEGGGEGVFVSSGTVPARHLVALYPGTVYKAGDTVLIQSLANSFVFKCADGSLVDGSSRGLSKMIYSSCSFRDRYGQHLMSDLTWLNPHKANPLAIGQRVNNATAERPANVVYQEADLPLAHFLPNLRRYLPNVLYNSTLLGEDEDDPRMRLVLLASAREIHQGEELLASYFTLIT